jgi:transglutaminase-like putative cysteine protease
MRRDVTASFDFDLRGPTDLVLAVAVTRGIAATDESLEVTVDGRALALTELDDVHGGRLHTLHHGAAHASVRYRASVEGRAAAHPVTTLDAITYTRPSRYCEADTLTGFARATFGDLTGFALLDAVRDFVHDRTAYDPATTVPRGSASDTLEARAGVCRDFAHLVIALLRALDVPARLVAVYAPQLVPMDFHAVVEAAVDGEWWLLDATGLAPRDSMLRIATGRDAADTAFLTNTITDLDLTSLAVTAEVDAVADEDPRRRVQLG